MSRKKVWIILGVFLFSLAIVRLAWLDYNKTPDHPKAVHGQLDLRNWDLVASRPIVLNGVWEFHPGQFMMRNESSEKNEPGTVTPQYLNVPESWGDVFPGKVEPNAYGYGTYRLRILVNPDKQQYYRIHIPRIESASELYINGELLRSNGRPASAKQQNLADSNPYSVSFQTDRAVIDISIHVANFLNPVQGGIVQPIKFGTDQSLRNEQMLTVGLQIIVAVIILFHTLYALILYIAGTRQKNVILFVLYSASAVIITLVDDAQLLFLCLPFSYEWKIKVFIVSYMGAANFLLQFVGHLLNGSKGAKVIRWLVYVSLLYALFVLVAPLNAIFESAALFYIIYFPTFLIIPIAALNKAMQNVKDWILLVLSASAITNNVAWGMLKNLGITDNIYYPFDWMIAFITFAAFWFRGFVRTSRQATRLADQLQKADKIKDDFLANTSHELRTPLHGIINMAQSVLEQEKNSLRRRNIENLELLVSVGQRMSLMLNDLLDLTQLRDGNIKLRLGPVQLQSVVSVVLDMLKHMAEGKPIRLVSNVPDSFPPVVADENRLIQILFNLVHNAIKFTPDGEIAVDAEIRNGQAFIRVSDTGIGMDEELLERAFGAYEQGRNSLASSGGVGLGLNICQQMVQLHGGTLTVESSPDQGSVFAFNLGLSKELHGVRLPLLIPGITEAAAAEETGIPNIQPEPIIYLSGKSKVLAVDDDPVNLKILANILPENEYDMVGATSGREALDKLDSAKWDLVIVDVMMPHMSGYELTRRIRERFAISELPILLLTARSRTEDIYSGFQAGANDYVTKPVNTLELKSRMSALIGLQRSINERQQMEAAYLQAQIQPHFLFNTLNSITALSDIDLAKMNDLIEAFSSYLRLSFDYWNSEHFVPIEHELNLVRSYLYIEKQRFGERLNVEWNVHVEAPVKLPPLTIQPLVENALRHGCLKRARGGTVGIRIIQHDIFMQVIISDDGPGMDEHEVNRLLHAREQKTKGIGLRNTDRRLKKLYGKGLTIHSKPGQGTTVIFDIPL
ncbi:ATP-binding protein [Paenibacillus sp. DMB20]|uniref:ATP-binding protein n=1 Tax=Paenibacillus sp. DMB20 TaxID=1642570 RepID=UPI0006280381|nr:ATP-binding protein [Paenibacillus sp. DMB20]KKO51069.1 hypothetical protein XI25_29130 [Paenibacillus sp. DMB20]